MTYDEHADCDEQLNEAEDRIIKLNERIEKLEAKSIDCPNRPASKTEVEMAKRLCNYQDEVHDLKQRIIKLETVMKKCIDAMKGSNCLEEQWLSEALKG